MSNIVVNTNNLQKSFNKKIVVENLCLRIPKGCIFGLLGPNGVGKTTTIRMILGLIRPDHGSVEIFGKDISSNREAILKNMGAMVETPSFYGNLNAWENLKIVCLMKQISTEHINSTLELVGLENCAEKKVSKFSLGMKQRLGIATAIIGNPKLVILDEPVNGLDPAGIHEIRTLIKTLAKKLQITFLISSHLLNEMELMADKVGIIKNGHLIYQGDLQQLMKNHDRRIVLGVNELKKAIKYFSNKNIPVINQGNNLVIEGKYTVEDISKELMEQGIGITSIYNKNDSLEDIYLKMMDE
ncbi:ABC transporter ATP-binding protein [Clostridium botulinum]|uniref:ABC transporter ATP-binding protein n=1 Tax=Clostridium botulinum TaxID=1491 RepID=A0A6G4HRZ1_CLOBO|nr:ABC transporter ATP-binding protein [Clostridium botulinum]MBD5586068.1 ABC transporter ATP-binding protein [Clostridium botulinum]MBO0570396.1 ABC transporter ATP-binding protein [Clostridium botulinum]MBO0581721.1 ABC transporter ATP-binding protein [Clostridium botulinum]NFJ59724.1 ABC transporter ATP-binding protein [Clostridium botulinum]NFJ67527.1 ABC transporter ATP-binding protein [Clostridium botulinum]